MKPLFSVIIPARSEEDPQLDELLQSIEKQSVLPEDIEIIVVTEGDSEQAKGIGIKKAKGKYLCMCCCDNLFVDENCFENIFQLFEKYPQVAGIYSKHYVYDRKDNSLNRYFSLLGANDVVPYWLGKADRIPWFKFGNDILSLMWFPSKVPSLGDNGFFFRAEFLKKADIDHYYPMDVCEDLRKQGYHYWLRTGLPYVAHKTATSLGNFLHKRFLYANKLFVDRNDRRWNCVEKRDFWKLAWYSFESLTLVIPFFRSLYYYTKTGDLAVFWHPVVSFSMTLLYIPLAVKMAWKRLKSFFGV